MELVRDVQRNGAESFDAIEAQVEIFWLAFQALPMPAQQAIRHRLFPAWEMPLDLAAELESWQTASAEALADFEALIDETQ